MCVRFVVSRLQGDSLSDNRSEENHRPHISEQAVPDISCMCPLSKLTIVTYALVLFCLFFSHIFSPPYGGVCFSSAVRPGCGGGAAAGMRGLVSSVDLGEYPPCIHQQTIKIALQSSITTSLPLSGLPLSPHWKKKREKITSSHFLMANSKPRLSFCEPRSRQNAAIERHRCQEPGCSVSLYASRVIV